MVALVESFLKWFLNLSIFVPFWDWLGYGIIGVTPNSTKNYVIRGFGIFYARTLLVMAIIAVVVVVAVILIKKYLAKKNPAKYAKPKAQPEVSPEEAKKAKTKKIVKRVLLGVLTFVLAFVILVVACALQQAFEVLLIDSPGNAEQYAPENLTANPNSILKGKKILWVGSSVVEGASARKNSMVEYVQALDGAVCVKDSVSGATISYQDERSYGPRMLTHTASEDYDVVVIQLSTNDASQGTSMGEISDSFDASTFDKYTTVGSMEIMLSHVKETWDCPVFFFTVPSYGNDRIAENYEALIDLTNQVCEKWGADVLDIWYDEEFNNVDEAQWKFWMANASHPQRAGYLEWWTPKFQEQLYSYFE